MQERYRSFNRLFINWNKTFVMFITNKRVILSNSITVDNLEVKAVNNFKLLGITLDSKLNFVDHASSLSLSINRKMFAIKRLFYLSYSVRLQFFKTFILPFFDFGLSYIICFLRSAIQKLTKKTYYNFINQLFKFNMSCFDLVHFNG